MIRHVVASLAFACVARSIVPPRGDVDCPRRAPPVSYDVVLVLPRS